MPLAPALRHLAGRLQVSHILRLVAQLLRMHAETLTHSGVAVHIVHSAGAIMIITIIIIIIIYKKKCYSY